MRGRRAAKSRSRRASRCCETPWNAATKLVHIGIKGFEIAAGRTAEIEPRLPDRHFGLDGRAEQAAAPDQFAEAARRRPRPQRHGVDRHLCRQRRDRAGADQGLRQGEDRRGAGKPLGRRLDGGGGRHPPSLPARRTEFRSGRREPRDARHRRRLQCRHHRHGGAEELRRASSARPAFSCPCSASAGAITTTS